MILPLNFTQELLHLHSIINNGFPLTFSDLIVQLSVFDSLRHHPVSAQANQCTSFASDLRPHPWRGGSTNGGHLERGGGSERSVSVCVQKKGLISRL
jgi:hypothetical protein